MERFTSPMPLPSEYEREILTVLIEEAVEVIQRATKLLRFGRDEVQPGQDFSNSERLAHEIGDFEVLVDMATKAGLIKGDDIENRKPIKIRKLVKYMQTEGGRDLAERMQGEI